MAYLQNYLRQVTRQRRLRGPSNYHTAGTSLWRQPARQTDISRSLFHKIKYQELALTQSILRPQAHCRSKSRPTGSKHPKPSELIKMAVLNARNQTWVSMISHYWAYDSLKFQYINLHKTIRSSLHVFSKCAVFRFVHIVGHYTLKMYI
jgi:hypothetical protein